MKNHPTFTRRRFLQGTAAMGLLAGLDSLAPAYAWQNSGNTVAPRRTQGETDVIDLAVRRQPVTIGGGKANPITINGSIPGPMVRLREGREAILRVTNHLDEDTSIHWHGILLPNAMDGVPGVTYYGIRPGETFTYRYPVRQNGTYWYHSHSGLQEQVGHYGPLIIDAAEPEPFAYDRDYVVMLSDWTFADPHEVMANLKEAEGYYNYHKRTVSDFFRDVGNKGWGQAWKERAMWGRMRMSSRDILDVTGHDYTYLVNGLAPESNWTALFRPGEKIRLRVINGSAMSFFDVRIPGVKMTVVAADGQHVQPVPVDEFRIGVAETYDVIVEPHEARAYTIFAESMDRSGYARATLAPRAGMQGPIPKRRPVPDRGMAAMGMEMDMGGANSMGMTGGGMGTPSGGMAMASGGVDMNKAAPAVAGGAMAGMQMNAGTTPQTQAGHGSAMKTADADGAMNGMEMNGSGGSMATGPTAGGMDMPGADQQYTHGPDHHGPGAAMVAEHPHSRLNEPGVGLRSTPDHRVLVYTDLRSLTPWPDKRPPGREVELHLTGNMERYMWSFDGKKFSEVKGPIRFHHGERLRLVLVNDTMMDHPIHLHGMWMELENGNGELRPRKHTISVKPGERVSALITAEAPGDWAFHCHLLYHMKAGMFRVVSVS